MRTNGVYAGIHLIGTAALLWLGYTWLGLGEARASALALSFGAGLAFLCLTCWLYGAAFPYFAKRRISAAFGIALRTLPALVVAAIVLIAIYWAVGWLAAYLAQHVGFHLASWMTQNLRRPVRPYTVQHAIETIFWVIRWIALPILMLPMVAAIALRGWRGFRAIGAGCCRGLFWLKAPLLVLLAVWIPLKLLTWAPHMKTFPMEMTSFVARVAVAYLLFVVGWLVLAFVASGGSPVRTQPRTVPSP